MALKGMHVQSLSKEILSLSSEISATVDFAAPYKCRNFKFGQGMRVHSFHARTVSLSPSIKGKWKQNHLVIKCRGSNGTSDQSENPQNETSDRNGNLQSNGPFRRYGFGRTRLARIVQEVQNKLLENIKGLQKNFPMKVFCLLLGFYCSTLFATSIGQTGDWDILSAGLAVVMVEGIGALMYRAYPLIERLHSLVTLFNYWKAGLSLGLFLDAFKYEMDAISVFFDTFSFEIDLFSLLWW
ncbi:hypothetical protein SUGI_0197310 [Cryptomeria japonica]|uniref:uncharacterized protein LOC131060610 n=1 Tax=Cryptomeria japonica TaxID=3369 RepID=UPI002408D829|nr:uncharacterized protein LOC131060610 [Cryptomeria japonica]GLJ12766.1 hypothetical protein SUGI_0197310 [Cryptomeria japonica]